MQISSNFIFIFNKSLKKSKKALIPGPVGSTEDVYLRKQIPNIEFQMFLVRKGENHFSKQTGTTVYSKRSKDCICLAPFQWWIWCSRTVDVDSKCPCLCNVMSTRGMVLYSVMCFSLAQEKHGGPSWHKGISCISV